MHPAQEPTFLPLTVAAARSASAEETEPGRALKRSAEEADAAAAGCWAALLGGCESSERKDLPSRLRELAEATSAYVGTAWWFGDGSAHRRRVAAAQLRIIDAVRDGDGTEFAEAFIGYDQAVATATVSVRNDLESPAS